MILKDKINQEDYKRAYSAILGYEKALEDLKIAFGISGEVVITANDFKNSYEMNIEVDKRLFEWIEYLVKNQKIAEIEAIRTEEAWQKFCKEEESKTIYRNGKKYRLVEDEGYDQGGW